MKAGAGELGALGRSGAGLRKWLVRGAGALGAIVALGVLVAVLAALAVPAGGGVVRGGSGPLGVSLLGAGLLLRGAGYWLAGRCGMPVRAGRGR